MHEIGGNIRSGAEAIARVYGLVASSSDPGTTTKNANTAALAAAQASLPSGKGGIIQVPWMDNDIWCTTLPVLASGQSIVGAGPRGSRLRIASTTTSGVTIDGASAGSTIVQCGLHNLALIGPSSGSGIGVHIKWGSLDLSFSNLYVFGWGSHGIYQEDTYNVSYRDVVVQSNGGDGWHCLTNINNTVWSGCRALSNTGAGLQIVGGAAPTIIGSDFELNGTYGVDFRYVFGGWVAGNDFEKNTLANMYLHWRTNSGEKCNGVSIVGNNFTGGAVTPTGLLLQGANLTSLGMNTWNAHTTENIKTTLTDTARTQFYAQDYLDAATPVTDGSTTTQYWDYDATNLWGRISPSALIGSSAGKLGFYGATPVVRAAAYTPTNVTPDRSYDADATSTAELADVLGTVIADLKAYGLLQ